MARPETAQDVVDLIRRAKLVGESDLSTLRSQHAVPLTSTTLLTSLVTSGLLTPYQAEELANGRWQGLWLGSYKVLGRLGNGGMGSVYLAEHALLRKQAAVKVLSAAMRSDAAARRRFVREARAAATIQHPNVVHVFTVDMDHDPPFLVMEYVDGISLQAAVSRHGALTTGETALIGVEIARGLQAAADVGLVHRDVKPANLLVDRRGGVKILDLGIVHSSVEETQTREADTILGTLDYLAPEQAEDSSAVDARADLYALGATLYFLLAGHPPFLGADVRQKLAAKCYSDPPPIHRLRPDVDPALSAVVQRLLARDPAARFQTATEVVAALTPFAIPPADFPARLFRSNHTSTINDTVQPPGSESALPPTVRILKATLRSLPHVVSDLAPTPTDNSATDELLKSPTAVEVAVPPELLNPENAPAAPKPPADRPPWLWGWVFAVGVIVAILATFLAFR